MVKYKFHVIVEQDEDGNYIGSVPELKGCHSYGSNMDELLDNIIEAIEVNIEALIKENKEIPTNHFTGIHEVEIEV